MRILIVAPSISSSAFLMPYLYAKILMKHHEVKIIGPSFGKKPFIEDPSIEIEYTEPLIKKPIQLGMLNLIFTNFFRLLKNDFDVVHCFKLLPHTIPVCVIIKKIFRKPLILTIDDYDKASPKNFFKIIALEFTEKFHKYADKKIVLSECLRSKYGGEVIYQPIIIGSVDKQFVSTLRKTYNLENKIVITHIGTFYDYKGIDVLIKAVQSLKRDDIKLILFEMKSGKKYKELTGEETIWIKKRSGSKSLEFTLLSNIYVIPTRSTRYSRAQTPAKIFEAMSMGKAIIASKISDISYILDNGNSGLLINPGNVESLKKVILKLVENKKLREDLGKKAKKRYYEKFSHKILESKINGVYNRI